MATYNHGQLKQVWADMQLKPHWQLVNGTGKGSLVFNFGGDRVVPELIQKFEPVKAPHKQLPSWQQPINRREPEQRASPRLGLSGAGAFLFSPNFVKTEVFYM